MGPERLLGNQFGEDKVQIDDAIVEDIGAIRNIMYDKLLEEPRLIVSLRVDEDSEFSLLSDVTKELQHIELSGSTILQKEKNKFLYIFQNRHLRSA